MRQLGASVTMVRRSARVERLLARGPRFVFVGTLAITSLVGLRTLLWPAPLADSQSAAQGDRAPFEDFAQGFARAYLAYDGQHMGPRERALRPYLPADMDADAGLVPRPRRTQEVGFTRVAGDRAGPGGVRVVTVAAGLGTRTLYIAVPVERAQGGALALADYPAVVGAPPRARPALPELGEVQDGGVRQVAVRVIRNYLTGATLNLRADLAPSASVPALGESLSVRSVDRVGWAGGSDSGAVAVTVEAVDARGALWTLTYELGLERAHGRLAVTFIEMQANGR